MPRSDWGQRLDVRKRRPGALSTPFHGGTPHRPGTRLGPPTQPAILLLTPRIDDHRHRACPANRQQTVVSPSGAPATGRESSTAATSKPRPLITATSRSHRDALNSAT